MGYDTVKSVVKALDILELLTSQTIDHRPLTLAQIAKQSGMLPVTARNLLRTLEQCGYARRVGHGQYREGEKCYRIFHSEGILRKLREVAQPIVENVVNELGESLLLVSLFKNRRVELLRCFGPDDKQVNPQWSANADYYQMRTTRAFLAWLSTKELEAFIEQNRLPTIEEWPECEESLPKLKTQLKKIRRAGGCMDIHSDYYAVAVPVLASGDEIIASLGCYAQAARTDKARAAGILKMLHDAAEEIRQQMAQ